MIRKATLADMPQILKIYDHARAFMASAGNPTQWGDGYPKQPLLESDISKGELYVVCSDDGKPHAAFAFVIGDDPTYGVIQDGDWSCDDPYGTIHRLGSDGELKGVFPQCLAFCKGLIGHIRADTHHDNRPMQHILEKHGFVRCGIIHVADGTPRLAYQYLPAEGERE